MDFTFSPEQDALREAVRGLLATEAPSAYVRRMIDDEAGVSPELWAKLADLGWLGLLVPEEHGGLGLGLVDAVVVQEEMGKLPFPGPYFSSAIFATLAALRLGAADLLTSLADGSTRAAVALCAETVGVCERALQLGVDYAKQRVQFGRPLASFQVIKHKAVDMLHATELGRVGTHYAAWTSDVDDPQRETAAAMAKGYVGEAAVYVTAEDIQIHGGVGFTWDADPHLFYRRAKANDVLLGHQAWQRQRLADLILAR